MRFDGRWMRAWHGSRLIVAENDDWIRERQSKPQRPYHANWLHARVWHVEFLDSNNDPYEVWATEATSIGFHMEAHEIQTLKYQYGGND